MVLNVGRRFGRRTEPEFDGFEFIERTRTKVLLMGVEFKPKRGYVLSKID
jgi:hypothetical protein